MTAAKRSMESGVSIVVIAVAMIFILAMAGLGIDLASFYVARSEAQRAADAAALAGAQAFVDNDCVTGGTGGLTTLCISEAKARAKAVGNKNLIQGVTPDIKKDVDITIPNPSSNTDPQIVVVAGRGTYDGLNHGNAIPTFFMKIFGVTQVSVSAKATAEAFNPSGTPSSIGSTCVKPWMLPNCDQFNDTVDSPDPDCAQPNGGPSVGPFVVYDSSTLGFKVARPEDYPNGVLGEPYLIKPGNPSGAAAPGQFYAAYLPSSSSLPTECPTCASTVTSGGTGSGALYRANIECCSTAELHCGETLSLDTTLQSTPGDMVGPTYQGVNCLINETGANSNCGQDYIEGLTNNCTDPPPGQGGASALPLLPSIPPNIMPGANNLQDPGGTKPIPPGLSPSMIVAPIYNGVITSGQNTVQIAGFASIFIRDTSQSYQGSTYAYIISISACGSGGTTVTGGSGSGGVVNSSYGTAIPVRLIN